MHEKHEKSSWSQNRLLPVVIGVVMLVGFGVYSAINFVHGDIGSGVVFSLVALGGGVAALLSLRSRQGTGNSNQRTNGFAANSGESKHGQAPNDR